MTDLEMIMNPKNWPRWPYLPLTRTQGRKKEYGLLVNLQDGLKPTVFKANIFAIEKGEESIENCPVECFSSFEEMLAAGWEVD